MSEPIKENSKTSKRSKRKLAMEPLGWDEIVSQPGMGGYLSFLNGPVPLPHLQSPAPRLYSNPVVVSDPCIETDPAPYTTPILESSADVITGPEVGSTSDVKINPDPVVVSDPVTKGHIVNAVSPEVASIPKRSIPEILSVPALPRHRLRIRRCAATHDGHSLGEEVLYQSLWKAASPESAETRTIVIGWRGMSQLCRMTPKNCKINTQRLIRKLALEVLSPYNTPESIGTTYRIYSDQAIFERRRGAGFEWVVRSRGVEFVSPLTGASIMPICASTH